MHRASHLKVVFFCLKIPQQQISTREPCAGVGWARAIAGLQSRGPAGALSDVDSGSGACSLSLWGVGGAWERRTAQSRVRQHRTNRTNKQSNIRATMSKKTLIGDWAPDAKLLAWCHAHGYDADLHYEFFRDYCLANGAKYASFDAAFRNCCRADWGGVRKNQTLGQNQQTKQDRRASTIAGLVGGEI